MEVLGAPVTLSDAARRILLRLDNGSLLGAAARLGGADNSSGQPAVLLSALEAEKAGRLLPNDLDRLNRLLHQAERLVQAQAPFLLVSSAVAFDGSHGHGAQRRNHVLQ